MRHRKRGRILNRTPAHRRALGRNLVRSLFAQFGTKKEYIYTTKPKAKEFKPMAEKLITLAKRGRLHDRRRAVSILQDEDLVKKLFEDIATRYKDRPGGYTRILKTTKSRLGDGSQLVIWGLVGKEDEEKDEKKGKKKRPAKPAKPKKK